MEKIMERNYSHHPGGVCLTFLIPIVETPELCHKKWPDFYLKLSPSISVKAVAQFLYISKSHTLQNVKFEMSEYNNTTYYFMLCKIQKKFIRYSEKSYRKL